MLRTGRSTPVARIPRPIAGIALGGSEAQLDGKIGLPEARIFPGSLDIRNTNPFEIRAKFHGDPEWISISEIPASPRIFLYSESRLSEGDILRLKQKGRELKQRVQFRSVDHAETRSASENPLAFISHDSRDKAIARQIAVNLQKMLCPVWYDEFSLQIGANLRDSIEKGIKRCKKCIIVLSPNFFSNGGWTKKEFDSIFTREIVEKEQVVLAVWCGVSKESVYDYSPSLLNVKGVNWNELGEQEVCRLLYQAIFAQK